MGTEKEKITELLNNHKMSGALVIYRDAAYPHPLLHAANSFPLLTGDETFFVPETKEVLLILSPTKEGSPQIVYASGADEKIQQYMFEYLWNALDMNSRIDEHDPVSTAMCVLDGAITDHALEGRERDRRDELDETEAMLNDWINRGG